MGRLSVRCEKWPSKVLTSVSDCEPEIRAESRTEPEELTCWCGPRWTEDGSVQRLADDGIVRIEAEGDGGAWD